MIHALALDQRGSNGWTPLQSASRARSPRRVPPAQLLRHTQSNSRAVPGCLRAVSVMPRLTWEPWVAYRKPIEGGVQDIPRPGRQAESAGRASTGRLATSSPRRRPEEPNATSRRTRASSPWPSCELPCGGIAARRRRRARPVCGRRVDLGRGRSRGLPKRRDRKRPAVLRDGQS